MTTKKEQIIAMLKKGEPAGYIAEAMETSKQYVYSLRSELKKNKKAKPKKAKQDSDEVAELKAQIAELKKQLPKVDVYATWAAECIGCARQWVFDGKPEAGELFVCEACGQYNVVEDVVG